MQLSDAIRQFLESQEVERGRSPATVRMYAFVLERFARFAESKRVRPTEGVTLELVRQFRLWLHRRPGRKGETLTRGTQALHLVVLRAFLKYLAKRDIPSLAAEKIELPKQEDRQVEFLEPEEVERLLAAPLARGKSMPHLMSRRSEATGAHPVWSMPEERARRPSLLPLRDKAILEVLFSTGMRVGELVHLTRDDVNLKRDEFAVRGKGGKVRVVFLSPDAREWLKKYLDARSDPSLYLFIRHDRAAFLSSSRTKRLKGAKSRDLTQSASHAMGEISPPRQARGRNDEQGDDQPLTARSVERLVQRYARAAGIVKPVHPHTLRHSFATDLLRGGAQLREVQAMLGHASVTTTQIYTHVTEQHLREAHQKFHRKRS